MTYDPAAARAMMAEKVADLGGPAAAIKCAPVAGTRVRLVRMGPDPDPIEPGATGTISSVVHDHHEGSTHLNMRWDNGVGRSLNLLFPLDEIEVLDG